MRKYLIGFLCGAALATTTAVYAGETIKSALFPVKYFINGESAELPEGYETLNYNSRVYVPIRFAAESLNAIVVYDDFSKSISIDNGFQLKSISSAIRAGHVNVQEKDGQFQVSAQLYAGQTYWDQLHGSKLSVDPDSEIELSAVLAFYNSAGNRLGNVPVSATCTADGDQLLKVTASTTLNIKDYDYVTLEDVRPEPFNVFYPPFLPEEDPTGTVALGELQLLAEGDYTKIRFKHAVLKEGNFQIKAKISFLDDKGNTLGTAELETEAVGSGVHPIDDANPNVYMYETIGLGNFVDAKKIFIEVTHAEKISK